MAALAMALAAVALAAVALRTAAAVDRGDATLPSSTLPSIVLIVADDLGVGEVSTTPDVATAHRRIETPNLARIFGQGGLVFDAAYAGYSVCGPSRTTLMTGRHAGNMYSHSQAKTPNLPSLMKSAGYATACFGKSDPLTSPVRSGFDHFIGQASQATCHDMYPPEIDVGAVGAGADWTVPLAGNNWTTNGVGSSPAARRAACMARPDAFTYTSDVFEAEAASWIRNQTGPFFAYVAYTTPHAGDWGTTKEEGQPVPSDLQYASEAYPDVEKDHAASVSYMDASIGRLVGGLDLENTLVFFVSDNGAHEEGGHNHTFFNSTAGLRGFKRSLYEGGVRSPSMVAGLGVPRGTRSQRPWAFWDLLPTLAELAMANVSSAEQVGAAGLDGIDGVSFAQVRTHLFCIVVF
jgi:arylsulfatase A